MHAGQDQAVKTVLEIGELFGQRVDMMVIDERDRADRLLVGVPLLVDEIVPDEVAQRLGAVRVLLPRDQLVEVVEEMVVERDAEADELFPRATIV
jgi:hypothetical protein